MFKAIVAAGVVFAGILVVWFVLAYGWQNFWGGRGVEALCAKDGGLRIERTMLADGFLFDMPDLGDCQACVEYLTKFNFVFVDINVQTPSDRRDTSLPEIGYYRMSLSTEGDPICEAWLGDPRMQSARSSYGRFPLLPSQCVAIKKLPERPSGAVVDRVVESVAVMGGQEVNLREWRLRVEPSGETLARIRDYTYMSKWATYFDFSGGGGTTAFRCTNVRPGSPATLDALLLVLRPRSIDPSQAGER